MRCPKCGQISVAPAATPAAPDAPAKPPKPKKKGPAIPPPPADEIEPVKFTTRKTEEDEMDLTPMVDVTFLLLIFFMITAAFSLQKALPIPAPVPDDAIQQSETEPPEEGTILVEIYPDNSIWINETEARSKQDLVIKIREAKMGVAGSDSSEIAGLMVKANKKAQYDRVIMVLDAGNEARMEPIKLQFVEDEF
ncbi:MAG: biopolymer transporter ExbD [Pirellulales bacterium]|nr:biopolymer transporter ExbD [Pirellulales bacterium]